MKKNKRSRTFTRLLGATLSMLTPGVAVVIDREGVITEQTEADFDRQFCQELGIPAGGEENIAL